MRRLLVWILSSIALLLAAPAAPAAACCGAPAPGVAVAGPGADPLVTLDAGRCASPTPATATLRAAQGECGAAAARTARPA